MSALAIGDRNDAPRWLLSAAVVVMAHGGMAAATMLDWRSMPPPPAAPAIMLELAPMPTAPAVERNDMQPGPKQVQADPPPPPEPEQEIEKVEEPPAVEPAVVLPRPRPHRRPKPPQPEPVVQRKPTPQPVEEPPAPATTAPPAAMVPPAQVAAAPPDAANALVPSNAIPTFQQRLLAHLERHKRYPHSSRRRGEEGVVHLRFVMDRAGQVLDCRIVRSSGVAPLDDEVLAMIHRAEPLPRIPDEIPQSRLDLIVPVKFELR
ncbi:MAG: energy transducer TonB [Alphaproteobacteria bacterium]